MKSARMSWQSSQLRWRRAFREIKPALFDDLILVVHLPWVVQVWEANLTKALPFLHTVGKFTQTDGWSLELASSNQFRRLEEAWKLGFKPKLQKVAALTSSHRWGDCLLEEAARV